MRFLRATSQTPFKASNKVAIENKLPNQKPTPVASAKPIKSPETRPSR